MGAPGSRASSSNHSASSACGSSRLTDSSTERGIQPACELTEIIGATETPLLDFTIAPDPVACPETTNHLRLVVNRTNTPAAGAYIRARCETPF